MSFRVAKKKGTFGDWLTAKRLTTGGYEKWKSKRGEIHGIDGVYVRYEEGNPQKVQKILIVENKVDGAQLNRKTKQMTKEWIDEAVEKMLENDGTHRTGELIRANSGLVSKELWRHDLDEGSTVIHRLDDEENKVPGTKRAEHYIDNLVQKRCESKQPKIVCHPVSN